MTRDTIKLGEPYTISVEARDAAGAMLPMDGTWQAACRITARALGGETVVDVTAMTLADGLASHEIDTGAAPWEVGTFVYDVRLTDPDGRDFWSDPVDVKILNRNTPSS